MSINDIILDTVSLVAESKISSLKFDKTVQMEIVSLADATTGKWYVKYQGNTITAYTTDKTQIFNEGDIVYVKIPEGNMSNKKIIESSGTVAGTSYSDEQLSSLTNNINEIEPDWSYYFSYPTACATGIISGVGDSEIIYTAETLDDYKTELFSSYAATYNTIIVSADFLTKFSGKHTSGNYGLRIGLKVKSADGTESTKTVDLDISSFVGSIYNYNSWSAQKAIFSMGTDVITSLDSITLFQESMEIDQVLSYDGTDIIWSNETVPNIFVQNIKIGFVQLVDLIDNLYYLSIATPDGTTLASESSTITLQAKLTYGGKNILSSSSVECYWFKRDASIVKGSSDYNNLAGCGWKAVAAEDFGQLEIKYADVLCADEYKLVTVYKEGVTNSATVTVRRYNSTYDLSIGRTENVLYLYQNGAIGDWYAEVTENGSYALVEEDIDTIDITPYTVYTTVNFYCNIYIDDTFIGVGSYAYAPATTVDFNLPSVVFSSSELYLYDADGVITNENPELERTVEYTIAWSQDVPANFTVSWSPAADSEINLSSYTQASTYSPEGSMLKNMWVSTTSDKKAVLHYQVRDSYNINYINNSPCLKVTVGESIYYYTKDIFFLKTGEQGTNGTGYSCEVVSNGVIPQKINGIWQTVPTQLGAQVYHNGDRVDGDSDNYTITYLWSSNSIVFNGADLDEDGKATKRAVSFYQSTLEEDNLITLTVKIKHDDESFSVVYNYPVMVYVGTAAIIEKLLSITIPQYVTYNSYGYKPSVENVELKCTYNNESNFIDSETTINKTILKVQERKNTVEGDDGTVTTESYIPPVFKLDALSSFDYPSGATNEVATMEIAMTDGTLYYPIYIYVNNYSINSANGWDGTSVQINEEGEYIYAPQIGAGEKDNQNRFSGVIMGINKDAITGLYGYYHGINTFGLLDSGDAYFGQARQIYFSADGTQATITGGKSQMTTSDTPYMVLNLVGNKTNENTKASNAVTIGDNFKVNYDGDVTANGGTVGGWVITENKLENSSGSAGIYSGTDKAFVIDEQTIHPVFWAGGDIDTMTAQNRPNFFVDDKGNLYAKGNVVLDGDVTFGTNEAFIANVSYKYLQNTSSTASVSNSGWSTEYPTPVQGRYIHTLTTITYVDGSTKQEIATVYNSKDGSDANLSKYGITILETGISKSKIESPFIVGGVITGNEVGAQTFKIYDVDLSYDGTTVTGTDLGELGAITGTADEEDPTLGVGFQTGNNQVIATDAGVRMSAGNYSIYVTDTGKICASDGTNTVDLLNSTTTVVPVFG